MFGRSIWCLLIGAALLCRSGPAQAMDFLAQPLPDRSADTLIVATGEIRPGDDEKLHRFVGALPGTAKLIGIVLSSPGGNLLEGVRLAASIRSTGTATGVSGECASACFLVFAAGHGKIVFRGARVGVHSASFDGSETAMTQAITTRMAREAAELGVPPSIIGKMVTTPPDRMSWLSREELSSMGVTFEGAPPAQAPYEPGSALRPGAAAGQRVSAEPVAAGASVEFLAGRRARAEWEAWFGGLSGEARAGAEWWAGARSAAGRNHLGCGVGTAAFMGGCEQARTMLTASDRRRSEPEFRAGWNSF